MAVEICFNSIFLTFIIFNTFIISTALLNALKERKKRLFSIHTYTAQVTAEKVVDT